MQRKSEATTADMRRRARPSLLFVNKTRASASLSHSEGAERIELLSVAQRTSRLPSKRKSSQTVARKAVQKNAACQRRLSACSECFHEQKFTVGDQLVLLAPGAIIPGAPPPAAINRAQLTAHFLQSWYPPAMPGHVNVISKLRQWFQPTKGAVALAAADSMITLHAARMSGDGALREGGMLIYQTALGLLRTELQKQDSFRDDSVLGAVEVMSVVETQLLEKSEENRGKVDRTHIHGLHALFLTRGPSILQSTMGRDILLHRLHEPLMVSLLARKASAFGNADWQAAFQSIAGDRTGKMYRLTTLGCRIPGALERADATINNHQSSYHQYMELLDDLIALEGRLMQWLDDRFGKTYEIPAKSNPAPISSTLPGNPPAELKDGFPFPIIIKYNCFLDALAHMNYWGLLLMLRKTILDVLVALESVHTSSPPPSRLPSPEMRAKCNETADLFCQNAFYVSGLSGRRSAVAKQGMVAFLISIVVPWYTQNQDEEKLSWCREWIEKFQQEQEDIDLVDNAQDSWTTKLYIGWVNMAF